MLDVILIDTEQPTFILNEAVAIVEHYQPEEVTKERLLKANLVLIDFKIDDWPSKAIEGIPEIGTPIDGLSLAHNVRRLLINADDKTPPAVALITNDYTSACKPLGGATLPHLLARLNGIEWVFKKDHNPAIEIESLASACTTTLYTVLTEASIEGRLNQLCIYLGINDPEEQEFIAEEIAYCAPPIHDLLKWEDGILILRWLLHRILPYPTMFVADTYLAERAQCDLGQLRRSLENLPDELKGVLYLGPGDGLFTKRFWRSKFERLLLSKGISNSPQSIREYLSSILGTELRACPTPIVEVVDSSGTYGNEVAERSEASEAAIDDWPPFATTPWRKND